MKHIYYWLIAASFLPVSNKVCAQSHRQQVRAHIDSALTARYYRTPYDTNYVVRPEGTLTLKMRLNESGESYHVRGDKDGVNYKGDLSTSRKTTVSIAASYRGLSAAVAINPAKLKGLYNDYELNLSYYSSRLSFDASYHRSTTLSGDVERGDYVGHLNKEGVKLKMFNLAGYYVFNHRRFSYPAAFTQSYIQRRSAGSWLAGISYQSGTIHTTDELKERTPNAPEVDIHVGLLGIGGGYGYNWVLGKKWLLHFSLLPTIVVYNHSYMNVDGERRDAGHVRFSMIFNERASIVYNFSPRYFAGATFNMSNTFFNNDVRVNQNKWRARALVGIRL